MKPELNKRFEAIISTCKALKQQYGIMYQDKCAKQIRLFSDEIVNDQLISKCNSKHWAMQLCIMNDLRYD